MAPLDHHTAVSILEMDQKWNFFEINFPIRILSGISNTSIFKVHDVFTMSRFLSN